jgi:hypothetical protein
MLDVRSGTTCHMSHVTHATCHRHAACYMLHAATCHMLHGGSVQCRTPTQKWKMGCSMSDARQIYRAEDIKTGRTKERIQGGAAHPTPHTPREETAQTARCSHVAPLLGGRPKKKRTEQRREHRTQGPAPHGRKQPKRQTARWQMQMAGGRLCR